MSIVRLIFVKLSAEDVPAAERVRKKECAPLMIRQKGAARKLHSTRYPGAI